MALNKYRINNARINQGSNNIEYEVTPSTLTVPYYFSRVSGFVVQRQQPIPQDGITIGEVIMVEFGDEFFSNQVFQDTVYWQPGILTLPDIEIKKQDDTGYIIISWGSIIFVPGLALPEQADITLYWGPNYTESTPLIEGTAVISRDKENESTTYELFANDYKTEALDNGVDINGNPVAAPLVVGTVNHMLPVRTGTDLEQRYYLPDFVGVMGFQYQAFEDGVEISDQWTDNLDGTISRAINIFGELSFSGTSKSINTLADLFDWGCTKLSLTLSNPHGADIPLDFVQYDQILVIDLLAQAAFYCNYSFYIHDGVLYLINNEANNGSYTVGQTGDGEYYETTIPVYEYPDKLKSYEANWVVREPRETIEQGRYLGEKQEKVFLLGKYGVEERNLTRVFNESRILVEQRLQALLAWFERPTVSITIGLNKYVPPMTQVFFQDGWLKVENISPDFQAGLVTVSGKGN